MILFPKDLRVWEDWDEKKVNMILQEIDNQTFLGLILVFFYYYFGIFTQILKAII